MMNPAVAGNPGPFLISPQPNDNYSRIEEVSSSSMNSSAAGDPVTITGNKEVTLCIDFYVFRVIQLGIQCRASITANTTGTIAGHCGEVDNHIPRPVGTVADVFENGGVGRRACANLNIAGPARTGHFGPVNVGVLGGAHLDDVVVGPRAGHI